MPQYLLLCNTVTVFYSLKVMGGLVGGLLIEPADWEKVPESMLSAESFVLVFTR